jgi:AcrR family transcriptional regulator
MTVTHSTPAPRQRRKRLRMPADEITERMFEAARQIVYAQGVQVSLEELGFEQVIELAGVSRSAAYRLWPYKGDFVQDLLCDLAGPSWLGTAAFDQETIDTATNVVMSSAEKLTTPEGRRQVLLEAIRQGVAQNFKAIVQSQEWHIYVALNASIRKAGDDESRLRIAAALQNSEMTFVDKMSEFYSGMLEFLGLRFRDDTYTVRHLAVAGAAVVEGLALRRLVTEAVEDARRPPVIPDHGWSLSDLLTASISGPPDAENQDWSLAALAFSGIVDALTEPVEPDKESVQLSPEK